MKKFFALLFLTLAAFGCSKEILSEQPVGNTDLKISRPSGDADSLDTEVFTLLNLDYPGLEEVSRYYAAGDLYNAGQALLEYWRSRPVYNPNVDVLSPSASASDLNIASQATSDGGWRFKVAVYTDGTTSDGQEQYYSFAGENGTIDWTMVPASLSSEKEFLSQKHRLQWMLPQARAYAATGEEKYILAWIDAWKSYNKAYPVPSGATEATEWSGLQPCSRMTDLLDVLPYYAHSENFTAEVLAYTLHTAWNHIESIRKNLFSDSTSNIRFSQEQTIVTAGLLLPEFKLSQTWFNEGVAAVTSQLTDQFNSDGVHNEFDPSYHLGVVSNFISVYKTAQVNGRVSELPADYTSMLLKAVTFLRDIVYPDYSIDNFNDTRSARMTKSVLLRNFKNYSEMFPDDDCLKWMATEGAYGKRPEATLITYPVSGYYMMRSGWNSGDIMLVHKNCNDPLWKWHNQTDNGHISLYIKGRKFLPDAGCYTYNDGSTRSSYASTEMHNTLTKNRLSHETRSGKLLLQQNTTGYEVLVTENAAYSDLTHRRSIFFVGGKYFVVVDEAYGSCTDTPVNLNYKLWGGKDNGSDGYPSSGKGFAAMDTYGDNSFGAHSLFDDGNNLLIKVFSETSDGISFESNTGYYSNEIDQRTQRWWFRVNVDKKEGKAVRFISVLLPYSGTFDSQSVSAAFTDNDASSAGTFHEGGVSVKVTVNGEVQTLSYSLQ